MRLGRELRLAPLALFILALALPVCAQQTDPNTGASTTNSSGTSGTNTRSRGLIPRGQNPMSRRQQERILFVSGSVVLDDGSPPPSGVVIERICLGRSQKEGYADSNGNFTFQLGANPTVLPDAGDDMSNVAGSPFSNTSPGFGRIQWPDSGSGPDMSGCELRAQAPGYRSSTLALTGFQASGPLNVGTIVLHPISKIPGTSVSATSLKAPRNARKALERAHKSIRNKKLDDAEKNAAKALEYFPEYAEAWFVLGLLHAQNGRKADAHHAFTRALQVDGNFVRPYIELGRLAALDTQWRVTAEMTDKAIALDPLDFPEAFYLNTVANFRLGRMDLAERSAHKTQRLDVRHRFPQSHIILAWIMNLKKDRVGEIEQLQGYLRYSPEGASARWARSRLMELGGGGETLARRQSAGP